MAIVIPAPLSAGSDFSRCNILALAPFLADRRLLRDTLIALGVGSVKDTGREKEAWEILDQGGVNVLFLDWSAQIDAIGFLRVLRLPDHPHRFTPVVVVTAFAGLDQVFAARDAGANEFLLRPWSQDIVTSRLRSIAQHPRLYIRGGPFFGPDRRRRRVDIAGGDRRRHENWCEADRRKAANNAFNGQERRQSRPGFEPLERRTAPRA